MKLYLATEFIYGDDRNENDHGYEQINGVFTSIEKLKETMPDCLDKDIREIETDINYNDYNQPYYREGI
jgi:hypothetical protein